jgi:Uma2 family endonuclease
MGGPAVQHPDAYLSADDFLERYEGVNAEWVDGQVVPMTPVTPRHQRIVNLLVSLFELYCDEREAGVVLSGPASMKLGGVVREPDVMLVARKHEDRITARCLEGPADLVVEVISPESRARGRGEKFYEYEAGGVREYWLIDPVRRQVEQHRLGTEGVFETVSLGDPPRLSSEAFPGIWIDPAWLWEERRPKLNAILKEWGLV